MVEGKVWERYLDSLDWLLFLVGPKCHEACRGHFDESKSDSWQVTNGVTLSSESSNKNLIVVINEWQGTILRNEGGNLLIVLFELNSDALSDGGVRLLGLNSELFNNDACSVRSSSEWFFPSRDVIGLVVSFVCPPGEVNLGRLTNLDACGFLVFFQHGYLLVCLNPLLSIMRSI